MVLFATSIQDSSNWTKDIYTCGLQGLQWYAEKLKMDEDGDVAQEFLIEAITSPSALDSHNLEVKIPAKPIRLKGPICIMNGNVYQYVETVPGVHSKC